MFRRRQSQNINTTVMFSNRTADFLHAPTHSFDLIVKKDADISGNVRIGGDLTIGGDMRARNYYATGNYFLNGYVLIPAGTIVMSAINAESSRIPAGWLDCDGSIIAINSYATLYAAIGTTYGSATTGYFKLPNLKGRVVVGFESSDEPIGFTGGEKSHTLTIEEMPRHSHTSNAVGGSIGLAQRTGSNTLTQSDISPSGELDLTTAAALTIDSSGGVYNDDTSTWGTAPHNNMQPYIVLSYIIKY